MKRFFSQIVAAILGLWLATLFVSGVLIRTYPASNFFGFFLTAQWQIIVILGITLGLINYFSKPLLRTLPLPLKMLSVEFFALLINVVVIWLLDLMFDELYAPFPAPLLYTALIVWGLSTIGFILFRNKK